MAVLGVWFRKDLRLMDNTALFHALLDKREEDKIILFFHLNRRQFKMGTKNHDYFFCTVWNFLQEARQKGISVLILDGPLDEAFRRLKRDFPDLSTVYFNHDETGFGFSRDQNAQEILKSLGVAARFYQDGYLHGETENKKANGTSYKVFTPYYRAWKNLHKKEPLGYSFNQKDFIEVENHENVILDLIQEQTFMELSGEKQALKQLDTFIKHHLHTYEKNRDFPALDATSRLSPYIRTGAISIRTVYDAAMQAPYSEGRETFMKELAWRDFYHMIYKENPHQKNLEIKEHYRGLNWNTNQAHFDKWKKGQTGFPIVDAAMRQLNETGWMHNRLRMIVASFLTKDLLTDWRLGERYFEEMLIDYDSASNIGGWQWAASTGTDAVPYFRIFNPTTQGERFDPHGHFIRQFVPELEFVPDSFIHDPQKMSVSEQQKAKCLIGDVYPEKIVDHQKMREQAILLYKEK
jgi:deoxyribodipyrimidine photo-lyase